MRNPHIVWAPGHGPKKLGPQDTRSRARAEFAEVSLGKATSGRRRPTSPGGSGPDTGQGLKRHPLGPAGGTPADVGCCRTEGEGRTQLFRLGPQTGPGAEPEPVSSVPGSSPRLHGAVTHTRQPPPKMQTAAVPGASGCATVVTAKATPCSLKGSGGTWPRPPPTPAPGAGDLTARSPACCHRAPWGTLAGSRGGPPARHGVCSEGCSGSILVGAFPIPMRCPATWLLRLQAG